jgi:nucleoside-diphosphate-sugar epimerase
MRERVLITGDKGFIGTHLRTELADHTDWEVFGHDYAYGDLSKPGVFAEALRACQPTWVVHLAAQVGRLLGEDDIVRTIRDNAQMTMLIAHACGRQKIRVLYASSSEIYGDQGTLYLTEDRLPVLPYNLYGLTKRWGEEVLRLYAPEGLRIARLSMPYGPGAPPGRGRRAMDNFLWQAHHRMPITVHRGAVRSWCYVGDTVRALRMIIENSHYEVYNVGRSDHPISMRELAHRACEMTDCPTDVIELVNAPADQTVQKHLTNDRLRNLGWRPTVELDEGMANVLDWVKNFDATGRLYPAGRDARAVHSAADDRRPPARARAHGVDV